MRLGKEEREKDEKRITSFLISLLVKDKLWTAQVRTARSQHSRYASEDEKKKESMYCTRRHGKLDSKLD